MLSKFIRFMHPSQDDTTVVAEEDGLRQALLQILQQEDITPLFQPIVDSKKGKLYGYETLSRGPKSSPLHMPEPLFATARKYNLLFALDTLCRRKAIARFQQLALEGKLFINIDPHCLLDAAHQQGATLNALQQHNLPCSRVVIELTEHQQVDDIDALKTAAAHYRDMGFTIAMDDLSAGYSNLQLMNELRPEFIKLDKYFVRKLAHDPVAKEFVRAICKLARTIDCAVVAEGVEQELDLKAARKLKIGFVQGYLLGRPVAVPAPWGGKAHDEMNPIEESALETVGGEDVIGNLALAIEAVRPNTRAELVFERLQKDATLMAVPVAEDGVVFGICERNAMLHRFAMRYGHELYGSKPVGQVMNNQPLMIDVNTTLDAASAMVTRRPHLTLYEPVVMLEKGSYVGLVYIHDILEHVTKQSITRAMECSPLTRLPGNVAIEREVNRRLRANEAFVLCYIDLDNFKAFNDRYGYERGDAMIRLMADILREQRGEGDFIGHIGGDDFIFVVEAHPQWQEVVEHVMEDFRSQATQLYDATDVTNGCIKAHDRAGNPCTFGLATLSIGAVPCPAGRYKSHLEAAEVAVIVKHQAKLQNGNSLQIDRRDHAVEEVLPASNHAHLNAESVLATA
ncbi:MAG: bifunctional diguanylate cyclase/phosphodiesterase [Mariprofundales bacterium]